MKLIKPLKNNQSINFSALVVLIIRCIICVFILAMFSCLLGRLMVFFKNGFLFFNWWVDFFYSLKVSLSTGSLLGFGVWIKAKLHERKEGGK